MREGLPAVPAKRRAKKERPPLDRSKMGFGLHEWEYVNPADSPTDFGPPDGIPRRDFNSAFNRANPATTVTIDTVSRPGALIRTTAPDWSEGEWYVVKMPVFREGRIKGFLSRAMEGEEVHLVDLASLGIVAERFTNLYDDTIITTLVSGGKANKATRAALTQRSTPLPPVE